jgi:hypothetical protein
MPGKKSALNPREAQQATITYLAFCFQLIERRLLPLAREYLLLIQK